MRSPSFLNQVLGFYSCLLRFSGDLLSPSWAILFQSFAFFPIEHLKNSFLQIPSLLQIFLHVFSTDYLLISVSSPYSRYGHPCSLRVLFIVFSHHHYLELRMKRLSLVHKGLVVSLIPMCCVFLVQIVFRL